MVGLYTAFKLSVKDIKFIVKSDSRLLKPSFKAFQGFEHLRKILRPRDRAQLLRDLSHAPVWMHPFIRHIADGGETPV